MRKMQRGASSPPLRSRAFSTLAAQLGAEHAAHNPGGEPT